MDDCLHTVGGKIALKGITMGRKDGENVVDTFRGRRKRDGRIIHLIYIIGGNFLTASIVGIKILQLDVEDSSL